MQNAHATYAILRCGRFALPRWYPRQCVKLHQRFTPPSFAIASFIGSASGLAFEHRREVGSVSGEVILSQQGDATPICPVTEQHSLFLSSAIRIAIDPPCGFTSQRERCGLTLFR